MAKKHHGPTIPTAPHPPHHTSPPPSGGGSSSGSTHHTTTHTGSGGGGGGGGGGSSSDPYKRYEQQQRQAANRAKRQHLDAAETLQQQVDALRAALNGGFRHALDQRLDNIGLNERQQDKTLLSGYRQRVGSLEGAAEDNEKATDAQTFAALGNRGRERMQALSEAFANGAGESDVMRAQEASLRNWNANQSEVNRSYFDTLRSVNSSLRDLNVDTKTARVNNAMQANTDREQSWQNFFDQKSETYTQLGNVLGQQAQELSAAANSGAGGIGGGGNGGGGGHKKKGGGHVGAGKTGNGGGHGTGHDGGGGGHKAGKPLIAAPAFAPVQGEPTTKTMPGAPLSARAGGGHDGGGQHRGGNGGHKKKGGGPVIDRGPTPQAGSQDEANRASRKAFMDASANESKAWDNPGVDRQLMRWTGHRDFGAVLNNDNRGAATTTVAMPKPEGAKLRTW